MTKHRESMRGEAGQSLIIVGALLIVLVALIGLVVDAGNAYAQVRIAQNGADAAALAGSQMLVHQEDYLVGGDFLRNSRVIATTEDFAERNGLDADALSIFYTDINGTVLADAKVDLGREDIITEETFGGTRAEGIRVEADRPFPTYFVRVIGRTDMTASATSQGILACGACTAGGDGEGLFPIAVYRALFDGTETSLPVKGQTYRMFEKDSHFPGTGSFGWLSWNQDGSHTSQETLQANMADTRLSGQWSVGNMIPAGPGAMNGSGILTELQYRIDGTLRNREVTLPIFDYTEGQGENLKYHVVGFGRFRLDCYHFSPNQTYGSCTFDVNDNSKWVQGTFLEWLEPTGESGCTNFGVCTAKLRPPLQLKRSLVGNVLAWQVRVTPQQSCTGGVDLVHVVDISGSMCYHWDSSPHLEPPCTNGERIQTAKDVITAFNKGMNWSAANQIGLATYPTTQMTSRYNTDCGIALGNSCKANPAADCGSQSDWLSFAEKNVPLTSDIDSVNLAISGLTANGTTSMASALQYGREMVTDPLRQNPDNLKIMVLTTDGMPNVPLDGQWSGYIGTYTRPPLIIKSGCNDNVYQAVIQQANLAKEAGIIVFTIGIQPTIDIDLMRAIASPDTDPSKPHFFQATTGVDFAAIYQQLQDRLSKLCSEQCIANENAVQGGSATVQLYDAAGNLVATATADFTGGFVFPDLLPGTYELRATWVDSVSGLLYDVPTWALGGDALSPGEKITVEIPEGIGTTHKDVYLRTSQQVSCN